MSKSLGKSMLTDKVTNNGADIIVLVARLILQADLRVSDEI